MSDAGAAAPSHELGAGSERVRLARLARAVALEVPGVIGTDAGPAGLFVTRAGDERLEGVTCVARSDGGYEVSLRLVCGLVPLVALGDSVDAAITKSAAAARLPLAAVNVLIAAVSETGGG